MTKHPDEVLRIEGLPIRSVYFDSSAVSRWADCEYLEHVACGIRATNTKVWMAEENFGEISNTGRQGGDAGRMARLYLPLSRVVRQIAMLPTAREIILADGRVDLERHSLRALGNAVPRLLSGQLQWVPELLDRNAEFQTEQNRRLFENARETVLDCLDKVASESLSDVMRVAANRHLVRLYKGQLRGAFAGARTRFPIGKRVNRRVLGLILLIRAWTLREHARLGHYGRKKMVKMPNAQDIKQALYLPYVDALVTNDEALEDMLKELRFWARLGPKWIGGYERFQASVMQQGFM